MSSSSSLLDHLLEEQHKHQPVQQQHTSDSDSVHCIAIWNTTTPSRSTNASLTTSFRPLLRPPSSSLPSDPEPPTPSTPHYSSSPVEGSSCSSHSITFPPWLIIVIWISISSAVIFYNALILRDWGFPYPITLTTLHLAFQTCATQFLARTTPFLSPPPSSTSNYAVLPTRVPHESSSPPPCSLGPKESDAPPRPPESLHSHSQQRPSLPVIDSEVYWKKVLPIGVLFSLSLVLSNAVYLYLSVAFIQMIKAASPVAVLLTSFAFGIHPPSLRLFGIVLVISLGIGIASYGEVAFSLVGFVMQVVAIVVEANRVVLIQLLLGTGMSPLTSLYFFAPVCLVINAALILPLEGFDALRALPRLGIWIILSNVSLTFLLNIAAVYLIQLSSLTLSLSKVGKDLIMIFGSALLLGGNPVLPLQWVGYIIALAGLVAYKKGI